MAENDFTPEGISQTLPKEEDVGLPRYARGGEKRRFGRPAERMERKRATEVLLIPTEDILPNPAQPRKTFAPEAIETLADSIRRYGILSPLTLRALCMEGKYELIAGERRLRAARLIGMPFVPAVLLAAGPDESAAMAIIENLQRENLTMFEEATAISALIRLHSLTQDDIARRLSVSQSYVANKLRLLRYLPDERNLILSASLTERHARALLRLSGDDRLALLRAVIDERLNVAETEALVEARLHPPKETPPEEKTEEKREKPTTVRTKPAILRDVRLFCNSLYHAMDIMRQAGVEARAEKRELPDATEIWIRIPREPAGTVEP